MPTFTPLLFQGYSSSYGYSSNRAPYRAGDVPTGRSDPGNFAYEWYRYGDGASGMKTNPPFSSDAAGRLIQTIHTRGDNGEPARILRGFIRRAEYDSADPLSMGRLYFMFNPTVIARDYVSYLDQGALDPFNTVFQSENLVAPPSMLNFTFELFFDRQDEARVSNNPGVLVDMELFDMVVRNVIPDPAKQIMPDNGVMMVNPRDITVVFSPEITVQGRPLNASVVYEKFTHRMIPTRMRIQLTMRVIYWGPQRQMTTYTTAEAVTADRVSYTATTAAGQGFTWGELEAAATGKFVKEIIDIQMGFIKIANATANGAVTGAADGSALAFAEAQVAAHGTRYDKNARMNLWESADCSSLVWGGYKGVNQTSIMGWSDSDAPSVYYMLDGFKGNTSIQKIWGFSGDTDQNAGCKQMQRGDLIIRSIGSPGDDHIAFVAENTAAHMKVFHAKGPSTGCGYSTYPYPVGGGDFRYNYGVRPLTLGGTSAATQNNDRTNL